MKRIVFLVLLLFASLGEKSVAMSLIPMQFGTPIVAGDKLFFNEFSLSDRRIICISRKDGEKLWEITNSFPLRAWFAFEKQLVVTVGPDIYLCEPESGKLKLVYENGQTTNVYSRPRLDRDLILVEGMKSNKDYLLCLDPSTWTKKWELPNMVSVRDESAGNELLLCHEQITERRQNGAYTTKPQALVAVSRANGKIMWRLPTKDSIHRGATVGNYFVFVRFVDSIICVNLSDGSVVKQLEMPGFFSLGATDNRLLICITDDAALEKAFDAVAKRKKFKYLDPSKFRHYYSYSLPDFKRTKISERDWYLAETPVEKSYASTVVKLSKTGDLWWDGVHEGYIYLSAPEPDQRMAIYEINAKTGKRRKLYEEAVPDRWRSKKVINANGPSTETK